MINKKGFTLIELLVVIAIIGMLSSIVLVSMGPARQKSRDARRISDVKQMALAIEMEGAGISKPITGCVAAHDVVALCGSLNDGFTPLREFFDPSDTGSLTKCLSTSTGPCIYSISKEGGEALARTDNYQICFYIENGSNDLAAGMHSIETGSKLVSGGCD